MEAPPPDPDAGLEARKRAIWLGLFPLTIGTAIYGSWRFTHQSWLVAAGMLWLGVGVIFVLTGIFWLSRASGPRGRIWLLLLVNFPAALLCMVSAVDVETRLEFHLVNESSVTLLDVDLNVAGEVIDLPDLRPGQHHSRVVRPTGEGELTLTFLRGPAPIVVTLLTYVGQNSGEYVEAVVTKKGSVTVTTTRPAFQVPLLP